MATRHSCRSPRSAATTAARDTGGSGCTATAATAVVPVPPAAAAAAAAAAAVSVGDGEDEGARSTAVGTGTTAAVVGGCCCCCCGGGVAPRCDGGGLPPPDIDLGLGASALGARAGVGREGAPPGPTVRAAWRRQTGVNDGRIKCGGDDKASRLLCLSPRAGASGLLLCMGGVKAGCCGGGGVNWRVTVLVTTLDPPAHSGGVHHGVNWRVTVLEEGPLTTQARQSQ